MNAERKDSRTDAARRYRKFYKTAAWQSARKAQLSAHPLCELCQQEGRVTAANVVNHRIAHKGDWDLFINSTNHQSLCAPHHDGVIQSFERTGRMRHAIGPDGWPVGTTPRGA